MLIIVNIYLPAETHIYCNDCNKCAENGKARGDWRDPPPGMPVKSRRSLILEDHPAFQEEPQVETA